MPLLTATSTFGLGTSLWSFPQQCYLHRLCASARCKRKPAVSCKTACMCVHIVVSDVILSYAPYSHHCSDVAYWRRGMARTDISVPTGQGKLKKVREFDWS